jgi:lysophospholipid acyltransferase (LPLAT)-like uncharacterized protein
MTVGSAPAKILGELMFRGARLFSTTIAVRSEGQDAVLAYKRERRPIVFVGWHGHDAIHLTAYRILFGQSAPAVIMVLDDVKGRVLEHFGQRMNLRVVSLGHDPESPQWARGVVKMIMLLRQGYDAMVAADGPHGPPLEAKAGAALIAQRARGVIVPSSAACSRKIELHHRWDNHLVPMPFSRTLVHFGAPIDSFPPFGPVPQLEDLRGRIQLALQAGTAKACAALQTNGPANQPTPVETA